MSDQNTVWDTFKQSFQLRLDGNSVDELREVVETSWPELADFDKNVVDDVAIKRTILDHFDQWKSPFRGRCRKALAYFIHYRNSKTVHEKIQITPFQVSISRNASAFTPDDFQIYQKVNLITDTFYSRLEHISTIDGHALIGLIVFSVMRFGGLCDGRGLHALLATHRESWFEVDQTLCIDLILDEVDESPQALRHIRRFTADPVSELLLRYWYRKTQETTLLPCDKSEIISDKIEEYLYQAGLLENEKRSLVTWLLQACDVALMFDGINGAERAYCNGSVPSYSVDRALLSRMVTGGVNLRHKQTQYTNTRMIGNDKEEENGAYNRIQALLQRLRNRKLDERSISRQWCRHYIKEVLSSLEDEDSHEQVLYEWLLHLLNKKHYKRYQLELSSIEKYVSILAAILRNAPYNSASEDKMIGFYNHLLKATTKKRRGYVSLRILQFEDWLINNHDYNYDGVDLGDIEYLTLDKPWTRAHFITPVEYARAKAALLPKGLASSRLEKIQALILILCYRLGLRRSEAVGIKLYDIQLQGDNGDVIVRFHIGEGKTLHAVRRLPIEFLADYELTLFREWLYLRQAEVTNGENAWLFTLDADDNRLVSDSSSIGVIRMVLKQVTGDDRATVHWLRHSFANCMVLLEAQRTMDLSFDAYNGILEAWYDEDHASHIRAAFAKDSNDEAKNVRNSFWMSLCTYIGHSSPAMTRQYYVHVMDMILANRLKDMDSIVSVHAACAILSIGKSTCYKKLAVDDDRVRVMDIRDRLRCVVLIQSDALLKDIEPYHPPTVLTNQLLVDTSVAELIELLSLEKCASSLTPISHHDRRWVDAANHLAKEYKTRRSRPRFPYVPRIMTSYAAKQQCCELIRLLCLHEYDAIVVDGVDMFARRYQKDRPYAIFSEPQKARTYLDFLSMLEIDIAQLSILYLPNRHHDQSRQDICMAEWCESLMLNEPPGVHVSDSCNRSNIGAIRIKVIENRRYRSNELGHVTYGKGRASTAFPLAVHLFLLYRLYTR